VRYIGGNHSDDEFQVTYLYSEMNVKWLLKFIAVGSDMNRGRTGTIIAFQSTKRSF